MMYAKQYALYDNRPGADAFNKERHPKLVDLMVKAVWPLQPTRILEVGCGNGSTLRAAAKVWPQAEILGLEPSYAAAESARAAGHKVVQGMLGPSLPIELLGSFDLIFSIQVIEHTTDPIAFLEAQASLLRPGGAMVVVCPNGAVPHAEIIHPDHLFSFMPDHLTALAGKAKLTHRCSCEFLLEESCEYNQLMVAGRLDDESNIRANKIPAPQKDELERLKRDRDSYLGQWSRLESCLDERVGEAARIFCFGAGGWAANLAGYAPAIWNKVLACTVDAAQATRFFDKPIVEYQDLRDQAPDAVIVAVNPARQGAISNRLRSAGFKTIRWDDLIIR
jgi:SAM-dependent methyltransferase